jgi:hypothetical protein
VLPGRSVFQSRDSQARYGPSPSHVTQARLCGCWVSIDPWPSRLTRAPEATFGPQAVRCGVLFFSKRSPGAPSFFSRILTRRWTAQVTREQQSRPTSGYRRHPCTCGGAEPPGQPQLPGTLNGAREKHSLRDANGVGGVALCHPMTYTDPEIPPPSLIPHGILGADSGHIPDG